MGLTVSFSWAPPRLVRPVPPPDCSLPPYLPRSYASSSSSFPKPREQRQFLNAIYNIYWHNSTILAKLGLWNIANEISDCLYMTN